jgi:hypothetical protein
MKVKASREPGHCIPSAAAAAAAVFRDDQCLQNKAAV